MVKLSTDIFFIRRFQIIMVAISVAAAAVVLAIGTILVLSLSISQFYFHVFVVFSIVSGITAPAIILIFRERRKNDVDNHLPIILEDISEGLRSGLTLIESIEETSKRKYGWTSQELQTLVAQMSWGISIEDAFNNFSKRVGTDMAKKTMSLLLSSIRLGGDLTAVFGSTSMFLREMLEVKEDRTEQLRPYLSLIYVTLIVFLVTMFMLYASLGSLFEMQSQILRLKMTREELKLLLYDMAILEGIFGGLIASKLSEGTLFPGLKHVIIMLLINTAGFIYFF